MSEAQVAGKRRGSGLCGVMLLWTLLVSLPQSAYADTADANDWLMRINEAAANLSFAGNFVYLHDDRIEAMHVVRRVADGVMQERLYALNGDAREVVRDQDRVWCFIPDKNVGVHDYRQTSESGFPRILPADLAELKRNYQFELGDTARIADHMAQQIKVLPEDEFRYGYSLWADSESGLLLRSDLVDGNGELVEQYMFVNIEIGRDISDAELESVTPSEDLVWYGMDMPRMSSEITRTAWRVESLPAGYRLSKHIRRMDPMKMEEEEHMVFTDGLSSVSVFVKGSRTGQSSMVGLSRMGAVHAYRETIADHWVTVMGEVPARTVKHLAEAVVYRP
jgi:sigma-E factor negative regulatory protein RseB